MGCCWIPTNILRLQHFPTLSHYIQVVAFQWQILSLGTFWTVAHFTSWKGHVGLMFSHTDFRVLSSDWALEEAGLVHQSYFSLHNETDRQTLKANFSQSMSPPGTGSYRGIKTLEESQLFHILFINTLRHVSDGPSQALHCVSLYLASECTALHELQAIQGSTAAFRGECLKTYFL